MMKTAQFDDAKHDISLKCDRMLMGIRYSKNVDHVARFYMHKRAEFSQMHHTVGTDRSYDPIMSDA